MGANADETVLEYRRRFPKAKIYAFEPISKAFRKLLPTAERDPEIYYYLVTLADCNGSATIRIQDNCL